MTPVPTRALRPRCLLSSFIHRNCLLRVVAGRPIRILRIVTPSTVGKQPAWPVCTLAAGLQPPRLASRRANKAKLEKHINIAKSWRLMSKTYDLHYWMGSIEACSNDETSCTSLKQTSHISTRCLFERNQTVFEILVFLVTVADTRGRALHKTCQTIQTAHLRRGHMLATNGTLAHSYYHQNMLLYWNMYDFLISKCYL